MQVMTDRCQILPDVRGPFAPVPGKRWLVLGSGPGARAAHDAVGPECDYIVTANGGIEIDETPYLLWLTDSVAAKRWMTQARIAAAMGTHVLCTVGTLRHAPLIAYAADLLCTYDTTKRRYWTPGKLCNGRTSGCFLTQLAVIYGAARVDLVGMSGYRSAPGRVVSDYDDGRQGAENHQDVMSYYGPMLQDVMAKSPAVKFVFHGRPNWPWHGPNVWLSGVDGREVVLESPDPSTTTIPACGVAGTDGSI